MANALLEVQKFGQSIWYDNIRRGLITSGELQTMIERDGLLGVTSNPSIFEKAIAGSTDYDQATRALVGKGAGDAQKIYETLAIQDIQLAADILYPVYLRTDGRDGYVSFEVSPHLAHDTRATVAEARRLRDEIGRDNVMIKVPATPEGVPAIRELIADGINVNVTLLFALEVYEAVADAYMTGLEDLLARGRRPDRIASVASFFISRIDTLIDDQVPRGEGGAPPAPSLGQYQHQESQVSPDDLCRLAHRTRHGQHAPRGDLYPLPDRRQAPSQPHRELGGKPGTGARDHAHSGRDWHFDEGGDRHAPGGRRS